MYCRHRVCIFNAKAMGYPKPTLITREMLWLKACLKTKKQKMTTSSLGHLSECTENSKVVYIFIRVVSTNLPHPTMSFHIQGNEYRLIY